MCPCKCVCVCVCLCVCRVLVVEKCGNLRGKLGMILYFCNFAPIVTSDASGKKVILALAQQMTRG